MSVIISRDIVASFGNPEMAERAAGALIDFGIKSDHISLVLAREYGVIASKTEKEGDKAEWVAKAGVTTTTKEDALKGSEKGAGIGLAAGTIAALVAVFVPGIGLVLGGGALAIAIGGALGSTAAGAVAGGLTGYLRDQGMPEDRVGIYHETLEQGGAILIVSPMDETINHAEIEVILRKYDGTVAPDEAHPKAITGASSVM